MKRHWLRGLLLGVSMALLLAGGVALAAPRMTIEPYCFVCCDNCTEPRACDGWGLSTWGWPLSELVHPTLTSPGPAGQFGPYAMPINPDGTYFLEIYLMCRECERNVSTQVLEDYLALYVHWQPGDYGKWAVELEGTTEKVEGAFYFADDPAVCQAMEFVPEPASILLLGSGLAGLAAYATLRWKSRE